MNTDTSMSSPSSANGHDPGEGHRYRTATGGAGTATGGGRGPATIVPVLDIVPNRLFFSRLPSGELEFSCLVPLTDTRYRTRISWTLRAAGDEEYSLAFQRPIEHEESRRGRALLSALLPSTWPDSVLTVDLGQGISQYDVHRFQQTQAFCLPLATQTLVAGGHRIGEDHRAAFAVPSQQFAWDVLGLNPDGLAILTGELSEQPRSEDFACFGQEVLVPAPGVVVTAVDGIVDMDAIGTAPGPAESDILQAVGNHVIIEHEAGVHSVLAHLKCGSVSVSCGQHLAAGTVVGVVGSSGNVSGPHLHFHFMDGPNLVTAAPLPVELSVEGETFAPTSGQIVAT